MSTMILPHAENHRIERIGWLRAAVLGANDGIISTASLISGVAASDAPKSAVVLAGVAGLVAGAASMAAGEYVSVSSQSDTERADREREVRELATDPDAELAELTTIYAKRGLDANLAAQVAAALTAHDALTTHLRDELGIVAGMEARPVQAAFSSAAAFAAGAILPLATAILAPPDHVLLIVAATSLGFLAALGGVAAKVGGSRLGIGIARVTFWGAVAMGLTALIGRAFGVNA